jgi:hypothetical protein
MMVLWWSATAPLLAPLSMPAKAFLADAGVASRWSSASSSASTIEKRVAEILALLRLHAE